MDIYLGAQLKSGFYFQIFKCGNDCYSNMSILLSLEFESNVVVGLRISNNGDGKPNYTRR